MYAPKHLPSRSYLLRCWQEEPREPGQGPVWRFSLQEVGAMGSQRWGFNNLDALMVFLRETLEGRSEAIQELAQKNALTDREGEGGNGDALGVG